MEVVLPSPEFDDTYERRYRRTVRESRGKELIIYSEIGSNYLSKYESYSYKFMFLSEPLKQQLIVFLDISIGQLVFVSDYNNAGYTGLITTPSTEIINSARNNNEFNLEIEKISSWSPPPRP